MDLWARTVLCDIYDPRPDGASGWSIVVCPGYGSVKELMASWGEALADRGHRVLVVGYRGYGEPDQRDGRIFPHEHIEDVRAASRWLRAQDDASSAKVAILGVSYGGAITIAAAGLEGDVDAAISIVGYGSGARHLRALRRYAEWVELIERVHEDRVPAAVTGESDPITLDEILLRDDEAQEWRRRVEVEYPGMRFDVTVESIDRLLDFDPESVLPFPHPIPLLLIQAERDRVVPIDEAHSIMARAQPPKRLVLLEDAEHHDVHSGENFKRCLDEVDSFLKVPE